MAERGGGPAPPGPEWREKRYGLKRFAFQTENAPEGMKKGNAFKRHCLKGSAFIARRISVLEHFQFEMPCISNHTACRCAEKATLFRSLWPGRHSAAASRFTFFKVETL
ncbi:hypothetical protein [uncultured Desulfovibrio sp.]|uniref:hypothetical protein n=1 Tax=uncultured Desulfovibrio sp. TaxID=167968 RepID=UPI00260D7AB8|nr:hypothetical protein [uncultured Desulfovibrio sp.]